MLSSTVKIKRPIEIVGSVIYIPLTQGQTATVSLRDRDLVEGYNWCAERKGGTFYATRRRTLERDGFIGKVYLHNVIKPVEEGFIVDHKDRNGLNNRRTNLRKATSQQNAFNRKLYTTNASGCHGVTWAPARGKWLAHCTVNGKTKYLGSFDDVADAIKVREKVARELKGRFKPKLNNSPKRSRSA